MPENKNVKVKIWVYAIVLFTSAFVVLLLTAMSQIRFNKNIIDYKSQIHLNENEKNKFKLNLQTAEDNIQLLKKDIEVLQKNASKDKAKLEEYNKKLSELKEQQETVVHNYTELIRAEVEYDKGNLIECAKILSGNIKPDLLETTASERYKQLKEKTYEKAAQLLFMEGYKFFKDKKFDLAVESFKLSSELFDTAYFSDDCYYYLSYSELKSGNKDKAAEVIQIFFQKYPNSSLTKDARELLKLINE